MRSNVATWGHTRYQQALGASLAVTGSTRNPVRAGSYPRPQTVRRGHPLRFARRLVRRLSPLVETDTSAGHASSPASASADGSAAVCGAASAAEAAPGSQRLTPLRVARRPMLAPLAGGRGFQRKCLRASASVSVILPPCATMASLPRYAPPSCNALHVERIPSLRSRSRTAGTRSGGAAERPQLRAAALLDVTAGASIDPADRVSSSG